MWHGEKGKKYITEMFNLITRLRELKLRISESNLVYLVLIFLLSQFTSFKISYNTQKKKQTLNKLITQCVQKKKRLRYEISECVHLASISQDMSKKRKRTNTKGKGKQIVDFGTSSNQFQLCQFKSDAGASSSAINSLLIM